MILQQGDKALTNHAGCTDDAYLIRLLIHFKHLSFQTRIDILLHLPKKMHRRLANRIVLQYNKDQLYKTNDIIDTASVSTHWKGEYIPC